MASRKAATAKADWRTVFRQSIARSLVIAAAAALGLFTLFLTLAFLTHDGNDAAIHTAAGGHPSNWMGASGAWFADLGLFVGGVPVVLLLPLLGIFSWRLWAGEPQPYWKRQLIAMLVAITLVGLGAQLWAPDSDAPLPAGWGGIVPLILGNAAAPLFDRAGEPAAALLRIAAILLLVGGGLWLALRALRLEPGWHRRFRLPAREARRVVASNPAAPVDADERAPTLIDRVTRPRPRAEPSDRAPPEIADPVQRTAPSKPRPKPQSELFTHYQLPSIDLLNPPSETPAGQIDKAGLERNARLLESVLEDFQVKGVITAVRPGPVVTMYELEPAPGTKASRVSNLADDIARNMSALSARIAPIPGRTVIGIELPNAQREPVVLHEMIGSQLFQDQTGALPIILGKNISGDPVIADLAPMPHLLIAGTTGSGKSVGLNAMILSLLYRLGPDQVKMIMIDPKMLELSVYDGIPHLLAPVVTEPKKAVRSLKWAVEQMEDRYRMMSSLSVRNLAGYNDKVRGALAKGKSLGRRVQTGYDPETGQPVYEEETLDYQPLPQIVVVVDELADLMMTAGKEVEFLIQRLAQKARAAGIHLILATQRPSVDVITGVIKANLPTRISPLPPAI